MRDLRKASPPVYGNKNNDLWLLQKKSRNARACAAAMWRLPGPPHP